MPGFTDVGDREEELWNAAFTETVDAVQDMFADLRRKGFFLESGNPPPQDVRMKPLPDYAANGVARKVSCVQTRRVCQNCVVVPHQHSRASTLGLCVRTVLSSLISTQVHQP
eukprot:3929844-Rhodomonas_salina.1